MHVMPAQNVDRALTHSPSRREISILIPHAQRSRLYTLIGGPSVVEIDIESLFFDHSQRDALLDTMMHAMSLRPPFASSCFESLTSRCASNRNCLMQDGTATLVQTIPCPFRKHPQGFDQVQQKDCGCDAHLSTDTAPSYIQTCCQYTSIIDAGFLEGRGAIRLIPCHLWPTQPAFAFVE